MEAGRTAVSFGAGVLMTLLLVVAVPIVVDGYLTGLIEQVVGDNSFLFLTSDLIVTILVWGVILGFFLLLGAGGILKRFGWAGIVGLVVAYWMLGDVTDAVLPLLVLAVVLVVQWNIDLKRRKENGELRKSG